MIKELTPLRALKEIGKLKDNGCYVNTTVEYNIIETALKEYEGAKKHIEALNKERIENSIKLKVLEIIKENLNIDEILLAVKGVCKASDYDLVKEVLL